MDNSNTQPHLPKMDMFEVPAKEFIDFCIYQEDQKDKREIESECSVEPNLLDEDYEIKQTYHLEYDDQDDNTTLSSVDYYQSSISSYLTNSQDMDTDMDTEYSDEASEITGYERSFEESQTDFEENISIQSNDSNGASQSSIDTVIDLKKSFLQLRGISVANYNMGCNFNIGTALKLMMRYELYILAIQEHTAWNRELSEAEKISFRKNCAEWGFLIYFSKLQIIILHKQLISCIRHNTTHEDGRIFQLTLEITTNQIVNFISVYGYPHSPRNRSKQHLDSFDENEVLQKMRTLRSTLKLLVTKAIDANELVFVYGDLQDTPDSSKNFYYGSSSITKHPLGIVQTCENLGLECTIYQHMGLMPKPITSRHGTKGGRFIDGMYTNKQGLQYVMGITFISDTGIFSDHDLVITKCDLGLQLFKLNNAKEEGIDFRSILNIPITWKENATHPSIADSVFKGIQFQHPIFWMQLVRF